MQIKTGMKIRIMFVVAALTSAPGTFAGPNPAYPTEKVAAFVVEKLDVSSLPSTIRPKKEKGKKTFADYGYTVEKVEESEAVMAATDGAWRLSIKVLDQKPSGIYVCVAESGQNGDKAKMQSVVLLKMKDPNALLKGRESFREFASCPVIGGSESTDNSYGD